MHGAFAWNELMTNDVERAKGFYATTLGWTYQAMPMPEGTYWLAKAGDKTVGGLTTIEGFAPPGTPPAWFAYLEVDDVDARIKGLAAAGGRLIRPPFEVPTVGRIAIVADATGAMLGWITFPTKP